MRTDGRDEPALGFVASVAEIGRADWERCFAGEIEGYGYHRAVESAGIPGFSFGWYTVSCGSDLVCAVPAFSTVYDLATTAQGAVLDVLQAIRGAIPGGLRLSLSCLGSPETEHCQIGFHPGLSQAERDLALSRLIAFWIEHSAARGIGLLGIKDISDRDWARFQTVLEPYGFRAVTSLPSSRLPIDFSSIDEYLARLSYGTRKDMRRKLRSRGQIGVTFTQNIDSVLPEVVDMYRETRARSDWAFEDLTEDYFKGLLNEPACGSVVSLYRYENRLVAANVLLEDQEQLLDKFFVMRADPGRDLNLYFLSWFTNIERCLARGLKTYIAGQAAYDAKIRLGCRIDANWICFRHRNRLLNWMLRAASPMLAVAQPERAGDRPLKGAA